MGGSYIVTKQEGTVGEAFPVHSAAFTVEGQEKFNNHASSKQKIEKLRCTTTKYILHHDNISQ